MDGHKEYNCKYIFLGVFITKRKQQNICDFLCRLVLWGQVYCYTIFTVIRCKSNIRYSHYRTYMISCNGCKATQISFHQPCLRHRYGKDEQRGWPAREGRKRRHRRWLQRRPRRNPQWLASSSTSRRVVVVARPVSQYYSSGNLVLEATFPSLPLTILSSE